MGRSKELKLKKESPETWREAMEQFLWFKKAGNLSQTTLEGYRNYIELFFKRFPEAFDEVKLKQSVYQFMAQQAAPAHYNLKLVYLKAFFNWCIQEGIFSENPLLQFKKRKAEGRVVNLEIEDLSRLLSLPDKTTFSGLRDYALLLLTLDTGIRPKEAFFLLPTDVNLHAMEVYVRAENAKTRISRTLPMMPVSAKSIRELIFARHQLWDNSVPVFCTQDGTFLNRDSWHDRMDGYSRKLGVKIRPYDLRHAFALQFLRNGGNALALQRTLGHSDLTMTKRYVALTQQDIKDQHLLASPLNTILPQRNRLRKLK